MGAALSALKYREPLKAGMMNEFLYHILGKTSYLAMKLLQVLRLPVKTKEEFKLLIASFIKKKKGNKTLKQFSFERGVDLKTLSKHETGVLSFHVILKYIDSEEELLSLYRSSKT